MTNRIRFRPLLFCFLTATLFAQSLLAAEPLRRIPLALQPDDVIPTGNEWIALPDIRASDAALMSFNVLSMRDRGLLEVLGEGGAPVLQPYFLISGKPLPIHNPNWELIEYWIPEARQTTDGIEATVTYCAPPSSRGALVRLVLTNHRAQPVVAALGMRASWGALERVTYTPVALRGTRTVGPAPWVDSAEVFSFVTDDTKFAWSVIHPGSQGATTVPPLATSPSLDAQRAVTLGPGESAEADFVLGAGVEEFSAAHNAKALRERLDREGAQGIIAQAAAWARARTRTTGQPDLDTLMNRNFLFTAFYAWGRTIDTEQFVGVTSRSPRYYVSAAYWDRDAMLWSFPGLLDIDPALAREALEYALGTQSRNAGIHSRFIDGVVLEDGFELDEGVAPVSALDEYVRRTGDDAFLAAHRAALLFLRDRLLTRFDPATGLYSTLQDAQDEYQKAPFSTYDNVLTWKAFLQMADLFTRLNDADTARQMTQRADALRQAILRYCVAAGAPGADGPIFVSATDGKQNATFADVPPGSLMKLPILGFVPENDPVFERTYDWLHSRNYRFSYFDQPYGLPGSYRLPISTSWSVADHLRLARGREQALKVLRASPWDGGIITEGVRPETAVRDYGGRAFATAAGYVAHAICEVYCQPKQR